MIDIIGTSFYVTFLMTLFYFYRLDKNQRGLIKYVKECHSSSWKKLNIENDFCDYHGIYEGFRVGRFIRKGHLHIKDPELNKLCNQHKKLETITGGFMLSWFVSIIFINIYY